MARLGRDVASIVLGFQVPIVQAGLIHGFAPVMLVGGLAARSRAESFAGVT